MSFRTKMFPTFVRGDIVMKPVNIYKIIFLLFLTLSLKQAIASSPDELVIKKLIEETYPINARSGSGEQYSSMYTEDALWMPPKAPDRKGSSNIATGFSAMVKKGYFDPTLKVMEINIINDEYAFVIGNAQVVITPLDSKKPKNATLRVFWIVRKVSGQWKIYRQIWNPKA